MVTHVELSTCVCTQTPSTTTAVTNSSKFVATAFRDDAAKAPAGKTTFVRVYATETIGEGREI